MIALSKFPESPSVNFDFTFTPQSKTEGSIPFRHRYANTLWKWATTTQDDAIYFPATNLVTGTEKGGIDWDQIPLHHQDSNHFGHWRTSEWLTQGIPVQVGFSKPGTVMGSMLTNEIWMDFVYPEVKAGSGSFAGDEVGMVKDGAFKKVTNPGALANYPLSPGFQNIPLRKIQGLINYTYDIDPNASYSSAIGYRVKPIFSHGNERIWKIEVSYAS